MNRLTTRLPVITTRNLALTALLLVFVLTAGMALAEDEYELSWWTVDSGGGVSQAEDYILSGTIGQPDAGEALSGDDYILVGGFWVDEGYSVYLPLVSR